MRRQGGGEQTILAALLAENRQRCQPPLPEQEVATIASSISKYSTGSESEHATDMGNAKRLVRRHGIDLRFCYDWNQWLVWGGT